MTSLTFRWGLPRVPLTKKTNSFLDRQLRGLGRGRVRSAWQNIRGAFVALGVY